MENIPRIYTALAEWLACMIYIGQYEKRLKGGRFWLAAVCGLLFQGVWLEVTDPLPVGFWMPAMAVAVGGMWLLIWSCCNMTAVGAGYCTIRAFLLAEFAASLEWQLYCYTVYRTGNQKLWLSVLWLVLVYGGVFFVTDRLERRIAPGGTRWNVLPGELGAVAVMGLAAFFISNLSFVTANTPFSSTYIRDIFNIRTLVDLAGVVILLAYHVQRCQLHTRKELDAIKNILQNQYVQYRQSRESIDLINRKYHDLKHQIAVLRAEEDPERRAAFLNEMEAEIQQYEAQNKTGNPVLDTVLTGKSLYCAKHQIKLTCVADGSAIGFMDVMDICTVFGNALDNAIEYELSIKDKEKRLIHLEVSVRRGFLVVRCENYYEGTLVCRDGLPVTTKADTDYHGYGLKSIRYTVEKYGGTMTVDGRDGWFVLAMILPIPQTCTKNN